MSFQIQKELTASYILYKILGENSKPNFIELADEMYLDGLQHNIFNFILDCANIHGALPISELFEVGNYFSKKLNEWKIAGINTPADWRNNSFSENVIYNRGGQLEHFRSIEDAEQWFLKSNS